MAFTVKAWLNRGDTGTPTPLNGAGMQDLEYRLSQRSDYVACRVVTLGSASGNVTLTPGDSPNVLYVVQETSSVTYDIDTANWILGGWLELRTTQPGTLGTRVLPKCWTASGVPLPVTSVAGAIDRYGFSKTSASADPDGFMLALDLQDSIP